MICFLLPLSEPQSQVSGPSPFPGGGYPSPGQGGILVPVKGYPCPSQGVPRTGVPLARTGLGYPPPPAGTGVPPPTRLATHRAVCLLRSRRWTFLSSYLYCMVPKLIYGHAIFQFCLCNFTVFFGTRKISFK